jgi:hypothetical protein
MNIPSSADMTDGIELDLCDTTLADLESGIHQSAHGPFVLETYQV